MPRAHGCAGAAAKRGFEETPVLRVPFKDSHYSDYERGRYDCGCTCSSPTVRIYTPVTLALLPMIGKRDIRESVGKNGGVKVSDFVR